MKEYVIDASVAIKWAVTEAHSDEAGAYLEHDLHAPDFLLIECGSILFKKFLTGYLTEEKARTCLRELRSSNIVLYEPDNLIDSALKLSLELRHSVYDCLYLALAVREDIPLVTADKKFYTAVTKHSRLRQYIKLL